MISLEEFKDYDKRRSAISKLTTIQQVHLAGKIAQLALPIYEKAYPNDNSLRKVVNLVLEYPNHTKEEYVEARNIAVYNAAASVYHAAAAVYYAANAAAAAVAAAAVYYAANAAYAAYAASVYDANRAGVGWNDLYNVFMDIVGNYEIEI